MTPIRPKCAPLPPGAVLPPMAAPEAIQGLPQTHRAADAGAGNGRGRQRPNKPNQTRQSSNSRGREPRHNPSRFETINTFVDVTLRDGQQSLWAEWMTTGMMLPVVDRLDRAGCGALEVLAPSFIGKCVRDLREDPIERVRLLAARGGRTPLRMNGGGLNLFGSDQQCRVELFWRVLKAAGIAEVRVSDAWNDEKVWKRRAGAAAAAGVRPIINVTYSISPRHTDRYFVERTRAAAKLKPWRLCLKDPGGLLTPERTRALVPLMIEAAGGIPIEMHTHCLTGLGPLCVLEAVQQGLRIVNTAIPPLAEDASLPSVFNVAANLRALGYDTGCGSGIAGASDHVA